MLPPPDDELRIWGGRDRGIRKKSGRFCFRTNYSKAGQDQTPQKHSYKLWKTTLDRLVQEHDNSQQLLRKNWGLREQKWDYQDIKELVLLNGNCSPVCHNQVNPETMKNQRTDGVRDDWNDLLGKLGMTKETVRKKKDSKNKRDVTPIYTFYQLRDTAASLLGNSMTISDEDPKFDKKNYSMDTFLFLGHAPKTTAEKNYVRIGENRIDDALEWLERQFFPDSKKNDENSV